MIGILHSLKFILITQFASDEFSLSICNIKELNWLNDSTRLLYYTNGDFKR